MKKEIFKKAFVKSLPIMCSYLFVSMAYGIMMEEAGFGWYDSLFISMTVYTGAFQFLLITLLSSNASMITIALAALLMNSRHVCADSGANVLSPPLLPAFHIASVPSL